MQSLLLILVFTSSIVGMKIHQSTKVVTRSEKLDERYILHWVANVDEGSIEFTATVGTTGYVGFGLSRTGGMAGSDFFIGGVRNGVSYGEDRHGTGPTDLPSIDSSQDYELLDGSENATHTLLRFRRKLNTCDDNDFPINHWYGETNRGSLAVNFLDPHPLNPDISPYKVWSAYRDIDLSTEDTVYWCTFHKAPVLTAKHQIIGFDVFTGNDLSRQHTHHVDVLKCTAPDGEDADQYFGPHLGDGYDCYYSEVEFPVEYCAMFEFQWSIGGQITMFPDDVGVPFGGAGKSEYYMIEVHYDNPNKTAGLQLQSGMEFYYTDQLREIDAGFLFLGSITSKKHSLTIPPNSEKFVQAHHCPSGCTTHFPEDGLNAFVYLLHSHLSGRTQRVRHFRGGKELPWFANDEHYDFNYQNNRMLREEIKILPGDHLTLECHYDTRWKNLSDPMINTTTTIAGRSPREEMCQVFIMYYPRIEEVNMCGSYFPQQKMLDYFGIQAVSDIQGEIDPMILEPWQIAGERYTQFVQNRIQWTLAKRIEFQEYTRYGAHQAYCDPIYSEEQIGLAVYPLYDVEYSAPDLCR